MSATAYGQQLSTLGLGDRTVQTCSPTQQTVVRQAYLMNVNRQRRQITTRANNVQGTASIMSDIVNFEL